jgi:hypothetical protein
MRGKIGPREKGMTTLTGFDDSEKTPSEWQHYIRQLTEQRAALKISYRSIRQPSGEEMRRYYSRDDVLSEFIWRAQSELHAQLK